MADSWLEKWETTKDHILNRGIGAHYQDMKNRMEYGQKYVLLPGLHLPYFIDFPEDPNYVWSAKENMRGYRGEHGGRDYFSTMAEYDIRSKQEHDIIKLGINQDEERLARLNSKEGWDYWGPALFSAVFDPLTYTPLGMTKGVAYIPNALRVGATSAGVIAADEVYRHANSHSATLEESIVYVSGAALFGGIFSTVPTKFRRMKLNAEKNKVIYNKKTDDAEINALLDAEQETYGGVPIDFDLNIDGITRTITRGKTGWTKNYLTEDGERVFIRDKVARRMPNLTYSPIRYFIKDGKEYVDVDDAMVKILYQRFKDGKDIIGIPTKLNPILNSERKFADFLVRREIVRDINQAPRTGKTLRQQEEELTNEVVAEAIRRSDVDFSPDFGQDKGTLAQLKYIAIGYAARGLDKLFSPFGKQASYLKKHREAYNMSNMGLHRLIGDWGTRNKFADRGMVIDRSVMMERDIKWGFKKHELDQALDSSYVLYTKGIAESEHHSNQFRATLFAGDQSVTKATAKQALLDGITGTESSDASHLSRKVTMQNFYDKAAKLRNKIMGNKIHEKENIMTKTEWDNYTFKLRSDDDFFIREKARAATPDHVKALDMAKKALDDYYSAFEKDIIELKMLADKSTAADKLALYTQYRARIQNKLKGDLSSQQRSFLESALKIIEDENIKLNNLVDEFNSISPPNENPWNYSHRIWLIENIEKHREAFKKIILKGLRKYTDEKTINLKKNKFKVTFKNIDEYYDAQADRTIDNILNQEAPFMDPFNILEFTGSRRVAPLMHRTVLNPNKDFINVDGVDFINTDSREVAAQYRQYMGTAIEMHREFGDKNAKLFKVDLMEKIAEKKGFNINEANAAINNFESQVSNLYGISNFLDPRSWSKRFVDQWKNITSLNSMGNVMLTSSTELARPIGIHGFTRSFRWFGMDSFGKSFEDLNADIQKQIMKQHSYIYTYMELQTLGGGFERMVNSDVGAVHHGTKGERLLRNLQKPYYLMNGLTQYTGNLKNLQAGISSHRFIEDAIALAEGRLSKPDTERLLAYGLNKRWAKVIKNLYDENIIQTVTEKGRIPLFLANIQEWETMKGGTDALRRFRAAVRADVERAVVTPNVADKYNMMHGKFLINNEHLRKLFATKGPVADAFRALAKHTGLDTLIKVTPTTRGATVSSPLLLPILQFYAWSIAANRKILASGLAGRDRSYMTYMFGALGFAHMANLFKINAFQRLNQDGFPWITAEQVLFDIETSGVLGPFSDASRIIENITGGDYGVRPYFDMDQMFGPKNEADLQGQIMGPSMGKFRDWYDAFMSGDPYALKYSTKQHLIGQNLYFIKLMNKIARPIGIGDIDDTVLDEIFDTEPRRRFGR